MTNEQKYNTPEERVKAFREFLHKRCRRVICEKECEVNDLCARLGYDGKFAGWLALESEEEKPEPCFYCGNKHLAITKDGNNLWSVSCTACLYESRHHENRDTVIAEHNRMARAAMAAKKGDMK